MPVYFPNLKYSEDGCVVLPLPENGPYAVISGDGTGISTSQANEVAFELKCPIPGKVFATDVYYELPIYYTTQILSQMAAKNCSSFVNVCFTKESSTVLVGNHDDALWHEIWDYTKELYGSDEEPKKPTRKTEKSRQLLESLKEFSKNSDFLAELPSAVGVHCQCPDKVASTEAAFYAHSNSQDEEAVLTLDHCVNLLESCKDLVQTAYDILRRPAKELLLSVVSNLDRTTNPDSPESPHAMPVMYHLSGSSLKMNSVRHILSEGINAITQTGLNPKVIAFDGQFLELSIEDSDGLPTTLCKFDKKVWEKAKSETKDKQIAHFSSLNCITENGKGSMIVEKQACGRLDVSQQGFVQVYTPANIQYSFEAVKTMNTNNANQATSISPNDEAADDFILQYLPDDIVNSLDDDILQAIQAANTNIMSKQRMNEEFMESEQNSAHNDDSDTVLESLLCALIASSSESREEKWHSMSLHEFRAIVHDPKAIRQHLTMNELRSILELTNEGPQTTCRKAVLINKVPERYGSGSHIPCHSNVQSLKSIVIAYLKKWPKQCTNILYAANIWLKEKSDYDKLVAFPPVKPYTIVTKDATFKVNHWYAQPTKVQNSLIQYIIDPHHILVNNRCRCCSSGMDVMGVDPQAWYKVAEAEGSRIESEKTGLSLELVVELRDRQRNAFAMTTFSEKVEGAMRDNGDIDSAKWCRLLREWYRAVDEGGVCTTQRIEWLLNIREHLLCYYRPGTFPPPGMYAAGLPMAQFEGILCNVDRRLQLYAMTKDGTFNHRAVSSLDSETMFGAFQVWLFFYQSICVKICITLLLSQWNAFFPLIRLYYFQDFDPKGTGVLRADDIPSALSTAMCLFKHKMDPER